MLIAVAPLAGAWVEIQVPWKRILICLVAPLAGAWVEILGASKKIVEKYVAPLAGAWVEIYGNSGRTGLEMSLPSRERGLKLRKSVEEKAQPSRSPRGSVG